MRAPRELKPRPLSVSLARLSSAVVIAAAMCGAARGATVLWDGDATGSNNSLSGVGLGGSGIWDNGPTANWWNGSGADSIWNSGDTAVFAGTAGTVTLGASVTAGNLVFNTTGYTVASAVPASTLTLSPNAIINLNGRSGAAVNATISSQLAGASGLTLNGNGGTLKLNFGGTQALTGALTIHSGTLQVNGFDKASFPLLAAPALQANPITFRGSGAFRYDNVGTDSAITQNLGALSLESGDGTIRIERTVNQNVTLNFTGLTRLAGATGVFHANNNASTLGINSKLSIAGAGTGFIPGMFAKANTGVMGFAFYDTGLGSVRALAYTGLPEGSSQVAGTSTLFADRHMRITGTNSNQVTQTIQSLAISGSGVDMTVVNGATITIANGGTTPTGPGSILKVGGGASTISQASGTTPATLTAGGGREMIIRADALSDSLTISIPISSTTGALTKSGDGTLTLSGSNAFTGTTYVNGGRLTIRGSGAAGGVASTGVVLAGGTYELLGYGANNDTVETIATGKNVTVTGSGTLAAGRLTPATDPATNKTLSFGNLTIGNQVLTADPAVYAAGANPPFAGAYFLSFTGTTTFTDALRPTFNVTGTQASGTTPGLTLGGPVSSANPVGFIKRGTGTLALTDGGSDFGGVGARIEVQEGLLSVPFAGALGNPNNAIVLNTLTANEGLVTTATFATALTRRLELAGTANSIEVFGGANTLTWNGLVSSTLPASLAKRGAGTLVLTNPANTFGGIGSVIDLQAGVLEVTATGALGNASNTLQLNTAGATDGFRASGNVAVSQSLVLAQPTNRIDVTGANTLTLNGIVSSAVPVTNLTKIGTGTLALTNPLNTFGGPAGSTITVQAGSLSVASGEALGSPFNSVHLNMTAAGERFIATGTSIARQPIVLNQGAASNATFEVTAGNTFTLAGVITGGSTIDLVKIGAGTLALSNPSNTFGGVGRSIDIQDGFLAASADGAMGAAGNIVKLNTPDANEGFRAVGTFTSTRVFNLANTGVNGNTIDVVPGNVFTLQTPFTVGSTSSLVKQGLGRLELTVAQNGSWNGAVKINEGAIRVSNAAALGTATGSTEINNSGGLEITGGITLTEPLTINTPGDNTTMAGPGLGGVLRSVVSGSTATYNTGTITVNANGNGPFNDNTSRSIVIGADSGTTFTIGSASTLNFNNVAGPGRATNLVLTGDSNNANMLNSVITRTAGTTLNLVKTGIGDWIFAPTTAPQVDGLVIRSGTLEERTASAGVGGNGELIPNTTSLTFNGGGTFKFSNLSAITAKTETLGQLTFTSGDGTVRIERATSSVNANLAFSGLTARPSGATGLFLVNGTSASFTTTTKMAIGGLVTGFVDPGLFAEVQTTGASAFAWYDTTAASVRQINYSTDGALVGTSASTLTASKHMQMTGAVSGAGIPATAIYSLNMSGTGTLNLNAGQTLIISNTGAIAGGGTGNGVGGLLKTGNNATSILGGAGGGISANGNELIIRTDLASDALTISAPIVNTGALTKTGLGTLTLSGSNGATGAIMVNSGNLIVQGTSALGSGTSVSLSGGTFTFQTDGDGTGSRQTIGAGKNIVVSGGSANLTVGKIAAAQALNKTITFGSLSIGNQVLTVTGNNGYGVRFTGATTFTDTLPPTLNVAGAQASNVVPGLTLAGVVLSNNGAGLIKAGTGTLVLENNSLATPNTFGGAGALIDIKEGVVAAGSDAALGHAGNNVVLNANSFTQGFRGIGSFATSRTFTLSQLSNGIDVTQGNVLTLNTALSFSAPGNGLAKNDNGVLELGTDSPTTWTGPLSLSAGALRLKSGGGLGAASHIIAMPTLVGAALQLSGTNVTYNPYALTLSTSGINNGGVLENVSGDNVWSGAISLGADNAVIGSSAGSLRLTGGIASSITTARSLFLTGAGDITLAAAPLAATVSAITKIGTGTATLGMASPAFVGNLAVNAGTLAIKGSGALIGGTGTVTVSAGGTLTIDDSVGAPTAARLGGRSIISLGGTFRYEGNSANSAETFGSLQIGTSAVTGSAPNQTFSLVNVGANTTIISNTSGAGTNTLTFPTWDANVTLNGNATRIRNGLITTDSALVFSGTNIGTASNRIIIGDSAAGNPAGSSPTTPLLTNGILARAVVASGGIFDFATYAGPQTLPALTTADSNIVVLGGGNTRLLVVGQAVSSTSIPAGARIASIIDANSFTITIPATVTGPNANTIFQETGIAALNSAAYLGAPDLNTGVAADTVLVDSGTLLSDLTANRTFNALKFSGTGLNVGGFARISLTLGSGGLLATGGSNTINVPILAVGGTQLISHIDTGSVLTISSTLTGTAGAVKADPGLLVLNTPSSAIPGVSGNVSFTGTQNLLGGTLQLGGTPGTSNNMLQPGVALRVGPGATLDLNGNLQLFGPLLTDAGIAGAPGTRGVITSNSGTGTLVFNQGTTDRNWSASITGAVNLSRSGVNTFSVFSPQTYTGMTQINGGTTILRDAGALTGTTAIDLNYASLTMENKSTGTTSSLSDNPDRINNAATLALRGGTLTLSGREQLASSEMLGATSLEQGYSFIVSTAGGTGINSSELTFASLTRPANSAATVNFNSAVGLIGSNPRILITAEPTPVNGIIGGWALVQNDFASYAPGLGVGALGQAGFPAFDTVFVAGSSQPTQNFKISGGTLNIPSLAAGASEYRLNTLNMAITVAAQNLTFTEGGDTLNLVGGGLIKTGNFANSFGATVDSGRLTAGGGAVSGTSDLYLFNNANTLTINSRIIDTATAIAAGTGKARLVISATGATVSLANPANSHTGGTVVNGGTVTLTGLTPSAAQILAGHAEIPAGGLTLNGATVTMTTNPVTLTTHAGQIAPANVVTLNGSSTLNLAGNNTLAGVIFNNNGGTTTPAVNTGGTLTIGASGIVVSSSNVTTTATFGGKLDLGAGVTSIVTNPIIFAGAGNEINPLQATLIIPAIEISGGINKSGAGVLQFNGQAVFTGPINVTEGGIQYGATNAGSRFSTITLSGGTRLNLNNVGTVIGSLAGSGTVTNSAGSQTLTTGFNNASTTFSGQVRRFGDGTLNGLNLTKIGTGTMQMTGAGSNSTGNLSVQGGTIAYNGAGSSSFGNNLFVTGGTLTLDNSGTNVNNRLGGTLANPPLNTIVNFGTLTSNGGTLNVIGNGGANTTESFGTFTVAPGSGVINLQPNLNRVLTMRFATFGGIQAGGAVLIRGLTDSTSPGPGEATIEGGTAGFGVPTGAGNGNPVTEKEVRPDMIGDTSLTGTGTSFITRDTVSPFRLRVLQPFEMLNELLSGSTTPSNYDLSAVQNISENTAGNSIVFQGVSGIAKNGPATYGRFGPNGSLLTQTVISGGILTIEGGSSSINVGLLTTPPVSATAPPNVSLSFHSVGDLTVNGDVAAGTGGLTKSGAGLLKITGRGFYTGVTTVNAGMLTLDGPQENSIAVVPGATAAVLSALTVNGGTLDLNGRSQAFGALQSVNGNTGMGGMVTNTGVNATLTSAGGTGTFSGNLAGDLNLVKSGNSTLTLTSPNSYTGTTLLRGGAITLQDLGALTATTAIDVNYGTFTINHGALTPVANLSPSRLPSSGVVPALPISLFGGTFALTSGNSANYTATHPNAEIFLTGGASNINTNLASTNSSSATLTLKSLTLSEPTATVNFGGTNLGIVGFFNSATKFNTAPAIPNNIIGPWATVGGSDFASYSGANGVIALASVVGGYSAATTLAAPGSDTTNFNITATSALANNTAANVLRVSGTISVNPAAGTTLTLGAAGVSGGLLNSSTTTTATIGSASGVGFITSGGSELFVHGNANLGANPQTFSTTLINSVIKDDVGAVALVKSGTGIVTLAGNNTYSGGTVVNQGTLNLSTPSANGTSVVAVPGVLLINNAVVTLTAANQLSTTAQVTIDGAGTLNMSAVNTVGRLTFNNRGGNGNPTVNTSTILTLSSSNAITSTNDTLSTTPLIAGTELSFSHSTPTITTSGIATNNLVLQSPIHSSAGPIVKAGSGSLALNPTVGALNANTATGQLIITLAGATGPLKAGMAVTGAGIPAGTTIVDVIDGNDVQISAPATANGTNVALTFTGSTVNNGFTVNDGSLIFTQSSNTLAGVVKSGPIGTGPLILNSGAGTEAFLMSDGAVRTIHNPVQVNGNFTFGAPASANTTALLNNGVILAGPVTLSSGIAHTISVNSAANVSTITGQVLGTNATLVKSGPGTLVLQNAANNWGGSLTIAEGVLRNGAIGAIRANSDMTVATGAVFDTAALNQSLKFLFGGGVVANSSTVSGATLTVGATTLLGDVNTFSGSISGVANPLAALGLTKEGAGTFILAGPNNYRGATNVNAGVLRVSASGSVSAYSAFTVNNGAVAEINGLIDAPSGGSGSLKTEGLGSLIRGYGNLAVGTTIQDGGFIRPVVGPLGERLTILDQDLVFDNGSTLIFKASLSLQNRIILGGPELSGNVSLPANTGSWKLLLENTDILNPAPLTFVLFDGDQTVGANLNGNTSFSDFVGDYTIDYGITGWSGGEIHYDFDTNDILLTGVVPEPSTVSMLLGSLGVALGLQRFRRRRK